MAPPTRNNPLRTPSPQLLGNQEATTRRKCKFFNALTNNRGTKSLRSISRSTGIAETTGRKWQQEFKDLGSEAKRRSRPRSGILGRKSKVTKTMCKMLVSLSRTLYENSLSIYKSHSIEYRLKHANFSES